MIYYTVIIKKENKKDVVEINKKDLVNVNKDWLDQAISPKIEGNLAEKSF
jgi:hypothetical protein